MQRSPQADLYAEAKRLEAETGQKYEILNDTIVAMGGGTPEHAHRAARLLRRIANALDNQGCDFREFSSDLEIGYGDARSYVYPDGALTCGPPELRAGSTTTVINPALVLEVVSPGDSVFRDFHTKYEIYGSIASIEVYVIDHGGSFYVFRKPAGSSGFVSGGEPLSSIQFSVSGVAIEIDAG